MADPFFDVPNNLVRKQSSAERILTAKYGTPTILDPVEYKHYEPYYIRLNEMFDVEPCTEDNYD